MLAVEQLAPFVVVAPHLLLGVRCTTFMPITLRSVCGWFAASHGWGRIVPQGGRQVEVGRSGGVRLSMLASGKAGQDLECSGDHRTPNPAPFDTIKRTTRPAEREAATQDVRPLSRGGKAARNIMRSQKRFFVSTEPNSSLRGPLPANAKQVMLRPNKQHPVGDRRRGHARVAQQVDRQQLELWPRLDNADAAL